MTKTVARDPAGPLHILLIHDSVITDCITLLSMIHVHRAAQTLLFPDNDLQETSLPITIGDPTLPFVHSTEQRTKINRNESFMDDDEIVAGHVCVSK